MKCAACGYEEDFHSEVGNDGNAYGVADVPFIEIGITSSAEWTGIIKKPFGSIRLFACPICGTVKMEV